MKLEAPLIATILGSLIFLGLFTVIFTIGDSYDVGQDLANYSINNDEISFNESFNKIDVVKQDMEEITLEFDDQTVEDTGSIFPFLSLGFKIGKLIFDSTATLKDMMFMVPEIIGIDPVIVTVLAAILIIIVMISILYFILGRVQQ